MAQLRTRTFLTCLWGLLFVLSGCSFLGFSSFGPESTMTPTPDEARMVMPTFTATPDVPPTATALPPVVVAAENNETTERADDAGAGDASVATPEPVAEEPTAEPTAAPTDTPDASASFTVSEPIVNVRLGPGTNYGIAGSVEAGQSFEVRGKNNVGDWLQICCVNGQVVWIFAQLGAAQNVEAVAIAQDIPPTSTPAPATSTPVPAAPAPTDTPVPAAPPPAADPCAGIGGDGCKFKVREGPQFAPNGGSELKLQLFFIHSGIDGGQPQGSYFVVLTKDGQNLGVSDAVRSLANTSSDGALGRYNYEYKIGIDKLPGNTVAGNYTMFVLDGNGERDSQDLNFSVPEGQGEIRVVWDQG